MGKKERGEHDLLLPYFPSRNLRPLKRMSKLIIFISLLRESFFLGLGFLRNRQML